MGLVKTTTTGQLHASQVIQFGAKFEICTNFHNVEFAQMGLNTIAQYCDTRTLQYFEKTHVNILCYNTLRRINKSDVKLKSF